MAVNINIPSQVSQTITDGVTDKAPSENAVHDALALKANTADLGPTAFSNDYNDLDNLPTIPSVTGFVPYTGAISDVDLGVHDLSATQGTFATSGNPDTLTVNHSSGSGKALTITKGGNGEGVYVNKTSGSGNAVTIVGDLEATNLKRTGGTSAQFLKANGSIDSTSYQPTLISGTNIKSINGTSLLGSGDITVGGGITVGTTAVTSGTIGRVFFQGTGDVVQQSASLFWDNTNARLGVGATPSTAVRLDIRAQGALSTDIAFRVRNSANNDNIFSVSGNGAFTLGNNTSYYVSLNPSSPSLRGYNGAAVTWQLSPWSGEHCWITNNNSTQIMVGVGTTTPTSKLHVYTAVQDTSIKIGTGAGTASDESACLKFTTTFAGTSFGGDALIIRARSKGTLAGDQKCAAEFSLNRNGTNALRASITSQSNLLLQAPTEDTNDVGVIYIPNGTAPTANLAGGGKLYVEGGALKFRGSSGTITVVAPA